MKPWERWERAVHEERSLGNHFIFVQGEKHWEKTKEKMKTIEQSLLEGIEKNWVYMKNSPPPPIELAWIIYSQIGWKGPHHNDSLENILEEEELWEDLPEIDPMEICLLCQEIENADSEAQEVESLLDIETLFCLRSVLQELAVQGIDIKEETFSKNWTRNKKRHKANKSGRMQEILAKEKDAMVKEREDSQKSSLLMKRTLDRKKRKKSKNLSKKGGGTKSPSKILASFFGLA